MHDIRCELSDELLVDSADLDLGCGIALYVNALHDLEFHRMGVSDIQNQLLSAHLGTETDSDQLKFLLEPFADAHDHVVEQRTSRSV